MQRLNMRTAAHLHTVHTHSSRVSGQQPDANTWKQRQIHEPNKEHADIQSIDTSSHERRLWTALAGRAGVGRIEMPNGGRAPTRVTHGFVFSLLHRGCVFAPPFLHHLHGSTIRSWFRLWAGFRLHGASQSVGQVPKVSRTEKQPHVHAA